MKKVIQVKNLSKKYGNFLAVDGITFVVEQGEVFGLLGENGAGKTTTLEMIEGLRKPSGGEINVLGFNVRTQLLAVKQKIGVQLQSSAYYGFLKLREILDLFGGFYQKKANIDELLKMVGLEEKGDQYVQNLSGGQKQRFSIIASLINNPEIVFLDEPTTGLDPVARRNVWEIIAEIKKQGKTIILTTHYMEEAEILCDHVAIMDRGKIIVTDETHRLIQQAKHPFKINFVLAKDNPKFIEKLLVVVKAKADNLERFPGKDAHYEFKLDSQLMLNQALAMIQTADPESLTVGRATLEDLFIELTGRTIDDEEPND